MEELEEKYKPPMHGNPDKIFTKEEVYDKLSRLGNDFLSYKMWEVYRAFVVFEDDENKFKTRPIIVFKDNGDTVIALKCTSKRYPDETYYQKYPLEEWELAGFDKQTYVCMTHTIIVDKRYIYKKLGKLKSADIENISEVLIG